MSLWPFGRKKKRAKTKARPSGTAAYWARHPHQARAAGVVMTGGIAAPVVVYIAGRGKAARSHARHRYEAQRNKQVFDATYNQLAQLVNRYDRQRRYWRWRQQGRP